MKVVILAGGLGTRLSEETRLCPKPMVEVGGRPMLWHIMKIYSHYGYNDFVILLGYMGYFIKEYFANYALHHSTLTLDLASNSMKVHANGSEPWRVTLLDTGKNTGTGGRILRARPFVENEPFMLSYGDGVANVDLQDLRHYHDSHRGLLTMTSVQPEGRYGSIDFQGDGRVTQFVEKPLGQSGWINGGFFVCDPGVFNYLGQGDATIFERDPMEALARDGQLFAYRHQGFWKCMDTLRDRMQLERLWSQETPPWKVW